jgi:hypothetical protein
MLSGAPGGGEDVLEDDLSYRSSAPITGTDTPETDVLDHTSRPQTERLCG